MRVYYLCLLVLFLISCTSSRNTSTVNQQSHADILIQNVNIIDVESGGLLKERDVVITGTKISDISAHGKNKLSATTTINGEGKYLIPGLWDMHVHTVDSSHLKLFVINGVTGIRDMGGAATMNFNGCESIDYKILMEWRKRIESGSMIGPKMFISGPALSNTGWHTSLNIQTPQEAIIAVRKIKSYGVDFIKVYEKIPNKTYSALASEAKIWGLDFAGHVPETVSLIEASDAGQRSIEHIRDALLMCFTNNREELLDFFRKDNWSKQDRDWGLKQFEQCPEIIKSFRKNKTWLVPTLTVERSKVAVKNEQL